MHTGEDCEETESNDYVGRFFFFFLASLNRRALDITRAHDVSMERSTCVSRRWGEKDWKN